MNITRGMVLLACALLLAACVGAPTPAAAPTAPLVTFTPPEPSPTATLPPTATAPAAAAATATGLPATSTPAATPTTGPTATLGPDGWKTLPVVPTGVSKRVQLIYQMGLLNGNNPRAYSKVGDCHMTLPGFMGDFDTSGSYKLGDYTGLQDTIDYFSGSHSRKSLASKQGLTAHAALSMLWVDWKECSTYETPLTCEYRLNKPMYALISFGTNDANGNVDFEKALRRVLEMTMGNGTIPILSTKADNAEGDNSLNQTIVKLAREYELPLWNFYAAVQPLPNHGLDAPDHMEHLTESPQGFTNFTGDNLKKYGWPVRNLTALQVLDAVRKSVEASTAK